MEKTTIKNRNGLDLVIVYDIPVEKPRGLIFIEHGFTANKEQKQIRKIAEVFRQNNYATVLFDATNSTGESGSDEKGVTFTTHYHDLEDVINWASGREWYQASFIVCGHSLGAFAAIRYAQNHPHKVRLLIPISPVVNGAEQYESRKKRMGTEFAEWQQRGFWERTSSSSGRTVRVPFSYMTELRQHDAYKLADKLTMPTVFINGDSDISTPLESTKRFFEALPGPKELIVLENCDHVFKAGPQNLKDLETALEDIIKSYL